MSGTHGSKGAAAQQCAAATRRACYGTGRRCEETVRRDPESGAGSALAVSNIRFGYGDGPDVLREVTLRLQPQQRLAVVGTTGSGKSTLASLLAGLRKPREGVVTFGETALADMAGCVAAQGTHHELRAANDVYAALWEAWSQGQSA